MGVYLYARVPNATRSLSAIFGFKTMNILILGAGRVGESVAESLVSEKNNITIVDTDPSRLQDLQARLDLKVIVGNGIQPTVLAQAGAADADMLIACAASDETNLVACKIAHERFNLPTTIARVRSPEFVENDPLTSREHGLAVDHVVCPEQIVTAYIEKLIAYPEALQVLAFAEGLLNLIAVRAVEGSPLVKHRLGEIPGLVPACELRVVAIFRNEKALMTLDGNSTIEHGDEVFVLAAAKDIHDVLVAMHNPSDPVRRLVIAGGGNVGLRLARSIAEDHCLKIIEPRKIRCDYLASQLPTRVLVLHGDASDARLLEDERIGDTDMFLALTNDDETHIMSALLVKQMGAAKVLAIVNRKAYADLVQGTQIDVALSPAHAAIGSFLTYV
ncbi:MAG: Trk system potassium transporter TrkA, partial [Betaproteobacteria bacterium]|nr:Trk system potassium transporter TrkA [Betaproteobacteria bacterium]